MNSLVLTSNIRCARFLSHVASHRIAVAHNVPVLDDVPVRLVVIPRDQGPCSFGIGRSSSARHNRGRERRESSWRKDKGRNGRATTGNDLAASIAAMEWHRRRRLALHVGDGVWRRDIDCHSCPRDGRSERGPRRLGRAEHGTGYPERGSGRFSSAEHRARRGECDSRRGEHAERVRGRDERIPDADECAGEYGLLALLGLPGAP